MFQVTEPSRLLQPVLGPLRRWAEQSQRRACHNAGTACTLLARRRREREEAQAYVDSVLSLDAHHRARRVPGQR